MNENKTDVMMKRSPGWWKQAAVYQIYPKSFQDTDGDGIGDLQGIIRRLPYLEQLGIDAIWLSPVCRSPQEDNGYDISDYQDIDPMFGTMADMEQLIAEADKHGIKIILDLVLNHTSIQHRWFREARKSKDNPYHDYYVWRDGVEGILPNDMRATFGGPAWDWCPECGQYYFHQFAVGQPDLNWDNPRVREELYSMIRFWMGKGVGGFRLDVIDQIAKVPDQKITANGPRLHEFLQEMNRETFGPAGHYLTVGEAWGATVDNAPLYSTPDGSEFSMVFQFEHIGLDNIPGREKWDTIPLELVRLKEVLSKWQTALYQKGWNSLFWNNHDLPRIVSRWGNDGEYRVESAKMLATILYGMQGTTFLFQGEELGMTNVDFTMEDYRDIETLNVYRERMQWGYPHEVVMDSIHKRSRDNARTPMQWNAAENAGFTGGEPWIRVNPNYTEINAEAALEDPHSTFYYYQKLIQLRKQYDIFAEGRYELLLPGNDRIFAYSRTWNGQKVIVVANFYGEEYWLNADEVRDLGLRPDGQMLISGYADQPNVGEWDSIRRLRPYECWMVLQEIS